ncbi:hypothetical protein ACFQU7_18115 [Pseudoroseomonas wenyumeiae]
MKREAESGVDAVRLLTAHGAKGLQAPVVILPDIGSGLNRDTLRWSEAEPPLPFWAPRKELHAPPGPSWPRPMPWPARPRKTACSMWR